MGHSSDDDELFKKTMRGVRPLRMKQAIVVARPRPPAKARFRRADEQAVLKESLILDPATVETGDELSFYRAGIRAGVVRKLRAGEFAVDAELDLHGMTAAEAGQILREFLTDALLNGLQCVRIIHGKGRRSGPGGPVLKNVVNRLLQRLDAVMAFASARPVDGGTGAVYVLLRKLKT